MVQLALNDCIDCSHAASRCEASTSGQHNGRGLADAFQSHVIPQERYSSENICPHGRSASDASRLPSHLGDAGRQHRTLVVCRFTSPFPSRSGTLIRTSTHCGSKMSSFCHSIKSNTVRPVRSPSLSPTSGVLSTRWCDISSPSSMP